MRNTAKPVIVMVLHSAWHRGRDATSAHIWYILSVCETECCKMVLLLSCYSVLTGRITVILLLIGVMSHSRYLMSGRATMRWVASTTCVSATKANTASSTTWLLRHVCHHGCMLKLLVFVVTILHRDTTRQGCCIRWLAFAVHSTMEAM